MKKNILLALFTVAACIVCQAQTYTTLGIGIASPNSTLQVHSADPYVFEEPILDPPRDLFTYLSTFLITNENTGYTVNDGFLVEQRNTKVTLKQQENDLLSIENHQGKIILDQSGYVGIGAVGSGVYKFNVNSPMRVNGALRLESNIEMVGGININSTSISLDPNGSAFFANQVWIGNGFHCSATGSLKVKDLRVTLTDWSDFVFDKSYHLMPLGEVEQYIAAHRHLPEVPSAAEVEENGVDVGEMNKLLLQKVEELTLYVIDLQKQIDELKSNK